MPRFNNCGVFEKWMLGEQGKSYTGTLHTDGNDIYTYNDKIGITYDKKKIIFLYTARHIGFVSKTTSKLCRMGAVYANEYVMTKTTEEYITEKEFIKAVLNEVFCNDIAKMIYSYT